MKLIILASCALVLGYIYLAFIVGKSYGFMTIYVIAGSILMVIGAIIYIYSNKSVK